MESTNKRHKEPTKSTAEAPYGVEEVEEQPRGFMSADDSLAYVNKKKVAVITDGSKEEEVVENLQGPDVDGDDEDQPYTKTNWKKRHDDLRTHYNKKLEEFREKEKELKAQLRSNRPAFKPPKTPEELATFREDNPDVYAVVESIAHQRAKEELSEMQKELLELKEVANKAKAQQAYAELRALVPDVDQIRESKDFHEWASTQPEEIQGWIYRNTTNAALAAKAINLYRVDRNQIKDVGQTNRTVNRVDPRLQAAQAVTPGRSVDEPTPKERIWTTSEIEKMPISDYEKYAKEIDQAYKEGRVRKG